MELLDHVVSAIKAMKVMRVILVILVFEGNSVHERDPVDGGVLVVEGYPGDKRDPGRSRWVDFYAWMNHNRESQAERRIHALLMSTSPLLSFLIEILFLSSIIHEEIFVCVDFLRCNEIKKRLFLIPTIWKKENASEKVDVKITLAGHYGSIGA